MKYEIQRFIDDKLRFSDAANTKKIVLASVSGVLFLVAAILIGRTLLGGGEPEIDQRTSGTAEQMSESEIQRVQEQGYQGGTRMVAPADG